MLMILAAWRQFKILGNWWETGVELRHAGRLGGDASEMVGKKAGAVEAGRSVLCDAGSGGALRVSVCAFYAPCAPIVTRKLKVVSRPQESRHG
jgi:hypothetical protein